jgi:signal peptide peptidase SppA
MLDKVKADQLEQLMNGEKVENVSMVIDNGLAIIPIYGVIGNNVGAMDRMCMELTDVRDVKKWIDGAMLDENVKSILFDVNSPGGEVTYVDELAKYIAEVGKVKNTVAYCNDYMCSSAYYLMAGCNEIYAHPASSAIGNIGVYTTHVDETERHRMEGYKIEVFSAGKFKTEGLGGTSMSEEYKSLLFREIEGIYNKFVSHVSTYRKGISAEDLSTALAFNSEEAVVKGYIDGLIEDPMELFVTK